MEEMSVLQEKSKLEDSHKNKEDQTEEVILARAKIAELQREKAVLERQKLEVQRKLDDLTKRFEQDKRREMADYNKEYLKFHDEMLAKVRKEVLDEAELKIKEYRLVNLKLKLLFSYEVYCFTLAELVRRVVNKIVQSTPD